MDVTRISPYLNLLIFACSTKEFLPLELHRIFQCLRIFSTLQLMKARPIEKPESKAVARMPAWEERKPV